MKLAKFLKLHNPETPQTPIFVSSGHSPVSAEINKILTQKLKSLGLPRITFHGLRHTHASILLYQGVSVLSVSKRLGHSNITTTQATYLHVIKELETQDNEKILGTIPCQVDTYKNENTIFLIRPNRGNIPPRFGHFF